ncbi:MAG: SMP-30/gluconolactonase/LRE family protein, partial [Mycobacterium leprae]
MGGHPRGAPLPRPPRRARADHGRVVRRRPAGGPRTVDAFDFDVERGEVSGRRTLVRLEADDGSPDGLAVDDDGHLWVAVYGAGAVRRYTPGGREVAQVRLPVTQPTCSWFGGPGRDLLFVTTCWEHFDAAQRARQPD